MSRLPTFLRSPWAFVSALLLGVLAGAFQPHLAAALAPLSAAYLTLLQSLALPFALLAVSLGLRRVAAAAEARTALGKTLGGCAIVMGVAAATGVLLASVLQAGSGFASLQFDAIGEASVLQTGISPILGQPQFDYFVGVSSESTFVPELIQRLGIDSHAVAMLGALGFAIAFAAQPHEGSRSLAAHFEAILRAIETMIGWVGLLLPAFVFTMAAMLTARSAELNLELMVRFLMPLLVAMFVGCLLALAVLARRHPGGAGAVLSAMRLPLCIGFFCIGPVAAVPSTIDALSTRLGWNRGLAESVVPVAAVFFRAGEALFFGFLAVFVANVYGMALGPADLLAIAAVSVLAAVVSAAADGARTMMLAASVLAVIDLSLAGLFSLFLVVDIICAGPRNVLSMLCASAILARTSRASIPVDASFPNRMPVTPVQLVFDRNRLLVIGSAVLVASAASLLAGIGIGLGHAGR